MPYSIYDELKVKKCMLLPFVAAFLRGIFAKNNFQISITINVPDFSMFVSVNIYIYIYIYIHTHI